ncbi:MAG TPA: 1-deoxy-D-xylulose-5-phosphate reductoisomerase [Thermoleophilia bacterium]|nr:1-deoxy-D-xylulose-5-phosphate reductoisomerase [Thermoleophilia bacterium]
MPDRERERDLGRRAPQRRLLILGATGSIGRQALDIVPVLPDVTVVGLAAARSVDETLAAAASLGVTAVAFHDDAAASAAVRSFAGGRVLAGDEGIAELIAGAADDAATAGDELTVLNGIVGAAGLRASLVTLQHGATLALANKESMVAGGPFVLAAARAAGARIIPVDSEHSAIFQCLEAGRAGAGRMGVDEGTNPLLAAEEILLTGSGGPFRGSSREELAGVTAAAALKHPNWVMGPKVTIDSATLMNKGLEVIEAHELFGVPYGQIRVVVHPQSIVHSLVRFSDGAVLAHLGVPDMRTPIGYALSWPRRAPLPMVAPLDLLGRELSFAEPDLATFRCLALARQAGEAAARAWAGREPWRSAAVSGDPRAQAQGDGGGGAGAAAPIALNAANEVAVQAFLDGRIGFLQIAEVVERTLERLADGEVRTLDDVFAIDAEARRVAGAGVQGGPR